jgi:hypothetical protein
MKPERAQTLKPGRLQTLQLRSGTRARCRVILIDNPKLVGHCDKCLQSIGCNESKWVNDTLLVSTCSPQCMRTLLEDMTCEKEGA